MGSIALYALIGRVESPEFSVKLLTIRPLWLANYQSQGVVMRLFLIGLTVLALTSVAVSSLQASETHKKHHHYTVVTITPRYLTAGTAAYPGEYRGSVPEADARFISAGRELPGLQASWQPDPWYLPYPHSTIGVDFGPTRW